MPAQMLEAPLGPGDRAPEIILDAITREGKVSLDDYRGRSAVLVGLYRGLHCPFCRRHIVAMRQLNPVLREKGVETLAVVNTPLDRARLYFRFHPMPDLIAAADPERSSHNAFGLPNLQITDHEDAWPHRVSVATVASMKVSVEGDLPEPMDPEAAFMALNEKDGYEVNDADMQMIAAGKAQLIGQFLLDRNSIVRWSFTEAADGGRHMFGLPNTREMLSVASDIGN